MKKLLFIGIVASLILLLNVNAYEYWASYFDENRDGWEIYLGDNNFTKPLYSDDGYICYSKTDQYNWYFVKLDWLDWRKLYGGVISFDIKVSGSGNYNYANYTVIIDLPGEIGTYFFANIPITPNKDAWTTYTVPILDEVFTRYGDQDSLLSDNLQYVRGMDIRGDILSGVETTCIDNVKIYPPTSSNHAILNADYSFMLPCMDLNGNKFKITFRYTGDQLSWEPDLTSIGTVSDLTFGCILFKDDFSFDIPLMESNGTIFSITFNYAGNGLIWTPDLNSIAIK